MITGNFIEKKVKVKIDRPMGYGFVPDVVLPKETGKKLDAYVLGAFEPLEQFEGKCIAVVHRLNDNDDKFVLGPQNKNFNDSQIQALTEISGKFF